MFSKKSTLFCALLLSLAVHLSSGTKRDVDYTEIPQPGGYKSKNKTIDDTLAPIYDMSHSFLDAILPVDFDIGPIDEVDWDSISQYVGFGVMLIFIIVVAILMPLIGGIFCCCRCCGNCGSKAQEISEERRFFSLYNIVLFTTTLILCAFLLFGIVVSMRSNTVIHKGTNDLFNTASTSVDDGRLFITNTELQVETLLTNNYREFTNKFIEELEQIPTELATKIYDELPSSYIETVHGALLKMDDVKMTFSKIKKPTNELKAHVQLIKQEVIAEITKLETVLTNCPADPIIQEVCKKVTAQVKIVETSFDPFNLLPDGEEIVTALDPFNFHKLAKDLATATTFDKLIETALEGPILDVKKSVNNAGVEIENHLNDFKKPLGEVKDYLLDIKDYFRDADEYVQDWNGLLYGCMFIIPLIFLILVVNLIIALLIGCLCREPKYKEKGCGNRSCANDFLMVNIMLIFIFSFVIGVVAIVYCAIGLTSQRLVCDTLENLENGKGLDYLDDLLEINEMFDDVNITLRGIITDCYDGEPIYKVLAMDQLFELEKIPEYLDRFDIQEAIHALVNTFKAELNDLGGGIDVDFTEIKELPLDGFGFDLVIGELNKDEFVPLNQLIVLLEELEEHFGDVGGNILTFVEIVTKFKQPNKDKKDVLIVIYTQLKNDIQLIDGKSFKDSIIEIETNFQDYLKTLTGSSFITTMAQAAGDLANISVETVKSYLERIVDKVSNEVGSCTPLANSLKISINAVCGEIIDPINAYWIAIFISFLSLIPCLFVFIILGSYFKQYVRDEEYLNSQQYSEYHPPGTRGSLPLSAYGIPHQQQSSSHYGPAPPAKTTTTSAGGGGASYPRSSPGNGVVSPPAGLDDRASSYPYGMQSRSLRRQQEYPYALGASQAAKNNRDYVNYDNYDSTKF